jgi:hypothetical protein
VGAEVEQPNDESGGAPATVDEELRTGLAELERYLEGIDDDRLGELVLPLASRWVLRGSGLDVDRLREEADVFVKATPQPDRILTGYREQAAYWVSQRMLLDEHDEPRPGGGREELARARAGLEERASLVEAEGFPRVAAAFRQLLEETAGGSPPADLLWNALALRIAESVLP